jgi:hypothetical protein
MSNLTLAEGERSKLIEMQRILFELFESQVLLAIGTGTATKAQLIKMTQRLFVNRPSEQEAFGFLCDFLLGVCPDVTLVSLSIRVLGKLDISSKTSETMVRIGILEEYGRKLSLVEDMERAVDKLERRALADGVSLTDILTDCLMKQREARRSS